MKYTKKQKVHARFSQQAIRSMGWDLQSSLAEVIDNSIDAGANNISITRTTQGSGLWTYVVEDDGCGMDAETMETALELSPDLQYGSSAIGHFGVGLNASIFNITSFGDVELKSNKDGEETTIYYSTDNVAHTKPSVTTTKNSNGTIITFPNSTSNPNEATIMKYLGATYLPAHLRNPKLKITFNGKEIYFLDPLYREEKVGFKELRLDFDVDGHQVDIVARLFDDTFDQFSSYDKKKNNSKGSWSKDNAGIYYRVNNRYVSLGDGDFYNVSYQMLYNQLRIEVNIPKELIETFGIGTNKSKVFIDSTKSELAKYDHEFKTIMKWWKSNSKWGKSNKITPSQLANLQKALQMVNNQIKKTQQNFLNKNNSGKKTTTTSKTTKNRPSTIGKYNTNWVDVAFDSLGKSTNHYTFEKDNNRLKITFNEDHPFTDFFTNSTNKSQMALTIFDIYSKVRGFDELEDKHNCVSGGLVDDLIESQSDFYRSLYL